MTKAHGGQVDARFRILLSWMSLEGGLGKTVRRSVLLSFLKQLYQHV